MNGFDWTVRYPLVVEQARRLNGSAIVDTEVVCAGENGISDFELLHSRTHDHLAVACAFDLLMFNDDDLRRKPFAERKAALRQCFVEAGKGFNTSSTPKATARRYFRRPASLALRGLFQNE